MAALPRSSKCRYSVRATDSSSAHIQHGLDMGTDLAKVVLRIICYDLQEGKTVLFLDALAYLVRFYIIGMASLEHHVYDSVGLELFDQACPSP
jgi:hypothetical protein